MGNSCHFVQPTVQDDLEEENGRKNNCKGPISKESREYLKVLHAQVSAVEQVEKLHEDESMENNRVKFSFVRNLSLFISGIHEVKVI